MTGFSQPGLREQLQGCLTGRVCFLGLGNPDYGDDGLGVYLSEMLCHAGMANVATAGTTPERHLATLAREGFEQVVFLDAVEFGGAPGFVVFLDAAAIAARFPQVSTHKISLGLLAQWAEANGMKAWLLGVEPESLKPLPQQAQTRRLPGTPEDRPLAPQRTAFVGGPALTATVLTTLEALGALLQNLQLSPISVKSRLWGTQQTPSLRLPGQISEVGL